MKLEKGVDNKKWRMIKMETQELQKIREKLEKATMEVVTAGSVQTAKGYAEKVIQICGEIEEYQRMQLIMDGYDENEYIPTTPEKFERFEEVFQMGIKELNSFFEPLGLKFQKNTVGGGRAIWHTRNGMSISDAVEAVNAPKTTSFRAGWVEREGWAKKSAQWTEWYDKPLVRTLRYEFNAGDAVYGDTATVIEVECFKLPSNRKMVAVLLVKELLLEEVRYIP